MKPAPAWRRYLRLLRPNVDADVDDELAFHIDMRAALYEQQGMSPAAAREEAVRRFGDVSRVRTECRTLEHEREREMERAQLFDAVVQDVRYAARALRKRPGFTAIAVLTLALGIGANTAIFSVVNAYLFRPMPVPHPEQMIVLGATSSGVNMPTQINYLNFLDIRDRRDVFQSAAAFTGSTVSMRIDAAGERRWVELVSDDFFQMLGIQPARGRFFTAAEASQAQPLVVLSYAFWTRRFDRDPAIIGRVIHLNGLPFTVVGVGPEGFVGAEPLLALDAFVPLTTNAQLEPRTAAWFKRRDTGSFRVMARRRADVDAAGVQAAMDVLSKQLDRQYPDANKGIHIVAVPELRARPDIAVAGMMPWVAGVFLVLVGAVLLIACANVANLMLARAAARQTEIALRTALGATPSRLIRQLLTESVLLAVMGLAAGLLLAYWVIGWLTGIQLATDAPVMFAIEPDWRVFAFTVVVAVGAGIISGLAPALHASRLALSEVLKEGGRSGGTGLARQRMRGALIIGQVAVSVILLICAGLFTRSVRGAADVDLGFRNRNLLMLSVDVTLQRYDTAKGDRFFTQLVERARTLPGVRAAAVARDVPLGFNSGLIDVFFEEDIPTLEDGHLEVFQNVVGDDYFRTMGFPMLAGREFTRFDTDSAPHVAVINSAMAKRFWPDRSPIGKRVRIRKDGPPVEIVGVTADSKYVFLNEAPRPFIYLAFSQRYQPNMTLHLDASADPAQLAAPARELVRQLDPELASYDVKTMRAHLHDGIAYFFVRLAATLATAVGLLGLIQTVVGLYGVISYAVSQRTREIGIRIALGARALDVLRVVMRQGLALTVVGLGIGLVVAFALTRVLTGLLFGVSATDPLTFVGSALILVALSLLSSFVPARRAARLEPVTALREE